MRSRRSAHIHRRAHTHAHMHMHQRHGHAAVLAQGWDAEQAERMRVQELHCRGVMKDQVAQWGPEARDEYAFEQARQVQGCARMRACVLMRVTE